MSVFSFACSRCWEYLRSIVSVRCSHCSSNTCSSLFKRILTTALPYCWWRSKRNTRRSFSAGLKSACSPFSPSSHRTKTDLPETISRFPKLSMIHRLSSALTHSYLASYSGLRLFKSRSYPRWRRFEGCQSRVDGSKCHCLYDLKSKSIISSAVQRLLMGSQKCSGIAQCPQERCPAA